ncbi:MAG TPA: hypothetical protein VM912_00700 [Terriglobales bacterium]|nr:hypothetical protein [Terriglobales bacterium]
MNPHSVFLRKGCILPNRLDPLQEPIGGGWTMVADLPAFVFDTMIRQAGWHFMWLQDSCARRGIGITRQDATDHALSHALNGISRRFNAAELNSVRVAKFLGLHIATVTLQPRQVQEAVSLANDNAN